MDFNFRKLPSIDKVPPLKSMYNDKVFWNDNRSTSWNIKFGIYLKEIATFEDNQSMNMDSSDEKIGLNLHESNTTSNLEDDLYETFVTKFNNECAKPRAANNSMFTHNEHGSTTCFAHYDVQERDAALQALANKIYYNFILGKISG